MLSSSFGQNRLYQLPTEGTKMSQLFAAMIDKSEAAGVVDWGLHQTSLEEVFLRIAGESEQGADPRGLS